MTDLRTRLHDALRDEEDARLPADQAAAMRRIVVAAARDGGSEPARFWFAPLAVAATLVAMVALGISVGQRFGDRPMRGGASDSTDTDLPARQGPDRARQLQFSTPGGTRIIWIFSSDLNLKTTP
jgi:hypothetical protein